MGRGVLVGVVAGALGAAVVLVAVSTAGDVQLAERPPSLDWEFGSAEDPWDGAPPGFPSAADDSSSEPSTHPFDRVLGAIVEVLLLVGLVTGAVYGAREAWRRRPRLEWRRPEEVEFDVLDEFATSVASEAAAQRAALEHGVARNAIVGCWQRLEQLVAAGGTELDPSDTSAELTARVLGHYDIDPAAIRQLSSLYREARFSAHEMDESARRAALDALEAVHAGLRRHASDARATR